MENTQQREFTELKSFLQDHFQTPIKNLSLVKHTGHIHVYRFASESRYYYIRSSHGQTLFTAEKLALLEAREKGAQVPEVILQYDEGSPLGYPFIILSQIPGKPLQDTHILTLQQKKEILYHAGIDLAKINSVKTRNFGWCNEEATKQNRIVTGYDSSADVVSTIASQESLPLIVEKGMLPQDTAEHIERYIHSMRHQFSIHQGYLAHGDFNSSHIMVYKKAYSGIIDFGDKLSADPIWDIATCSIDTKNDTSSLLQGWLEQMQKENRHIFEEYNTASTENRIIFYRTIIALLRAQWIVEHNEGDIHPYLQSLTNQFLSE